MIFTANVDFVRIANSQVVRLGVMVFLPSHARHLGFYFCLVSVGIPCYTHYAFQEITKFSDKYKHPPLYHSIFNNTIAI